MPPEKKLVAFLCFSASWDSCGLGTPFLAGAVFLGPLQHAPTKEACCPGIGRGDPVVAELRGLLA